MQGVGSEVEREWFAKGKEIQRQRSKHQGVFRSSQESCLTDEDQRGKQEPDREGPHVDSQSGGASDGF